VRQNLRQQRSPAHVCAYDAKAWSPPINGSLSQTFLGPFCRGRYHEPGQPPHETEKPLHLHITPAATLPPVRISCLLGALLDKFVAAHRWLYQSLMLAEHLCLSLMRTVHIACASLMAPAHWVQDPAMRQRAVDAAAAEVEAMIQGHPLRRGPGAPLLGSFQSVPPPGQAPRPPVGVPGVIPAAYAVHPAGGAAAAGAGHSAQLPIGFSAPPEFNLPARIRGASKPPLYA